MQATDYIIVFAVVMLIGLVVMSAIGLVMAFFELIRNTIHR